MTESRVISPQGKIGARPTGDGAGAAAPPEAPEPKKRRRLPSLIIGVAVLAAAAAAYWMLLGPGAASADGEEAGEEAPVEEEVELGAVQVVDSVSVNLAGGHYLRLGLGLQLSADAGGHGELDVAKALDSAIALYSGREVAELADVQAREDLKNELASTLEDLYHGEVVGVYYTDFVTQ